MDDAKKIIDEASREGLHMSQGLLKLVLKMWESAREDVQAATAAARRLRLVAVLAAVLAAVCLCVCVYQGTVIQRQGTVIQRQGGELAAIHRILEEGVVIEETTTATETTTTQTVDGDSATINNVDGEQYNDNAVKVLLDTARR